jgi:hypothetical protein
MNTNDSVTLYRPVGAGELELIRQSGFTAFPPRLAGQPIFYPVLEEEYAIQIARDWNTKYSQSGNAGFVLRFRARKEYLGRYSVHQVGSKLHREYWIPAEDLAEFNRNIVGKIEVVEEFRSSDDSFAR